MPELTLPRPEFTATYLHRAFFLVCPDGTVGERIEDTEVKLRHNTLSFNPATGEVTVTGSNGTTMGRYQLNALTTLWLTPKVVYFIGRDQLYLRQGSDAIPPPHLRH
ncbi:MAG: hypothetical protein GC129_04300 [Proteobacteria bacterium]|nr:hypothetical protein [Pseudomonadota bacterium]